MNNNVLTRRSLIGKTAVAKFIYSYTSNYASNFGNYTCIPGKVGTLYAYGGEGCPR